MTLPTLRTFVILSILLTSSLLTACTNKWVGTYSNANGSIMLDLKSGEKASLTFAGQTRQCTYKTEGEQLMLDCGGDFTIFDRHEDGSITGPGLVGMLKKS